DVPHNSLLTRLGDTPARAVRLARYRTVATALASLLAAAIASADGVPAITPLLCGMAAAGALIGSAMVPLLIAFPPTSPASPSGVAGPQATDGLPLPFLVASVIGIVALGALAKAVLHLPPGRYHPGTGTSVLILLIVGRAVSALLPVRLRTMSQGLRRLALVHAGAAVVAAGFAWTAGPAMLVMLGLAMGAGNLVGWAILPLLAIGPRGYGLYTMASKLAVGLAGVVLAGGLGRVSTFAPGAYVVFALTVAIACLVAAAIFALRLTQTRSPGFPAT
ncbi:hypothetical protein LPN01_17150, partial [Sphingomonas sp. A2-49]|uniref:hypothetical protein n=1 Tax=Sphingomonas sp. A2-49 TaxID=1391375 RepID=UPI0021CE7469